MKDEKEEIKPAPLGEGKLPENWNHAQRVVKDVNGIPVGFEAFNPCVNKEKPLEEHLNKISEKLGESSEEQNDYTFGQKKKGAMKRADWLAYCLDIGWTKDQLDGLGEIWDRYKDEAGNIKPSPTSEAPEEQEELWDEVLNYCANHYINDVRVREYMQKNFIIHRKRD